MKAKKIRVATDLAIPPAGMMDANMKPDRLRRRGRRRCSPRIGACELEFVQTTGATRIPNVQTGKADIIISTLSVTPERAKVIDFTKRVRRAAIGHRRLKSARREELRRT